MIIQDDLAIASIVSADEKTFIATRRNGTSFYFKNPASEKIKILEQKIAKITPSEDSFLESTTEGSDDTDSSNIIITQGSELVQTTKFIDATSTAPAYYGSFMEVQTPQHKGIWGRFWENTKNGNGDGIGIGAGGLTILGSGESPFHYYQYLKNTYTGTAASVEELERTYVTGDQTIYIVPNCNEITKPAQDAHVEYSFDKTGLNLQSKALKKVASLQMSPATTTSNSGGIINFYYNQSTNATSSIEESASGAITISGGGAVTKVASGATHGFNVKATNLLRDENYVASGTETYINGAGYYIADKNNSFMARFFPRHKVNGDNILRLEATRTVDGTAKYAGLEIGLTSEGNAVYAITTPANFRNALGATNGVWPASSIPTLNQNTTGNAATATKLQTARELYVALGSTRNTDSPVTFDGSAGKAIHVSGTLPIARGGTGSTTAAAARTSLGITRPNLPTKSTWVLLLSDTNGKGAGLSLSTTENINLNDYNVFKVVLKGIFIYANNVQKTQTGCCLAVREGTSIYGTGGWDDGSGTFTVDVFLRIDSSTKVTVMGASSHRITTDITASAHALSVYTVYGLI